MYVFTCWCGCVCGSSCVVLRRGVCCVLFHSLHEHLQPTVREVGSLRFDGSLMRHAREDFLKTGTLSFWAGVKVRELFNEVEQIDEDRKSIAQSILQRSTNFLRRIIVPIEGQGGSHYHTCAPRCHRFPMEDYICLASSGHGQKQCNWWCAACGGRYNRILVIQDSTDRRDARVFRARAAPHGVWSM